MRPIRIRDLARSRPPWILRRSTEENLALATLLLVAIAGSVIASVVSSTRPETSVSESPSERRIRTGVSGVTAFDEAGFEQEVSGPVAPPAPPASRAASPAPPSQLLSAARFAGGPPALNRSASSLEAGIP